MAPCSRTNRTCIYSSGSHSWRDARDAEARADERRNKETLAASATSSVGGRPILLLVVVEDGGPRRARPREVTGIFRSNAGVTRLHCRRGDLAGGEGVGGGVHQGPAFREGPPRDPGPAAR